MTHQHSIDLEKVVVSEDARVGAIRFMGPCLHCGAETTYEVNRFQMANKHRPRLLTVIPMGETISQMPCPYNEDDRAALMAFLQPLIDNGTVATSSAMNLHDFLGEPETQYTPKEITSRMKKLEMLLDLLFSRIEKETGEEVLLQPMNTEVGYNYIFGPTRAEKEAFEEACKTAPVHPVYGNPVVTEPT